jgi:hypothetical protein
VALAADIETGGAAGALGVLSQAKAAADEAESTSGFWAAFFNSVSMIIVTELGDKTFFIAAVLAMRHDRLLIFAGAMGGSAVATQESSDFGPCSPPPLTSHDHSRCFDRHDNIIGGDRQRAA